MSEDISEERRQNTGESCLLFDKCFQMTSGYPLLAQEVTKVKNKVDRVIESEGKAEENRRKNNEALNTLIEKVNEHIETFNNHDKKEMEKMDAHTARVEEQTEAMIELTKTVSSLAGTVEVLVKDTEDNSRYIDEATHKALVDEEVAKKLKEEKDASMWHRWKDKFLLATEGIVAAAVLYAGWELLTFMISLDNLIKG